MRKGLIVLLAAVLVAAFALPATADLSTSGFVRAKARIEQNYTTGTSGGLFILPSKDPATSNYVEQRQRFIFDWNSENVGARGYFEIDFAAFGDSAYAVGRGQGAGLMGDSINLETKNFYIWFNVPNTSMKVTVGLQSVADPYDAILFGTADMAGIFLTGKMEPVSYRLGWSKWVEGSTLRDDDVDFYVAELGFSPTKDAKIGLNFHMLRDASSCGQPTGCANGVLSNLLRVEEDYLGYKGALRYDPSMFYYVGLDGSFKAGPVVLSGWAFYNFGKFKEADFGTELPTTAAGVYTFTGSPEDVDVKAWAASLRADANLGPGKFFLAGAYVSGHGEDDTDYKAIITGGEYALAGAFPFYKFDMQILFPNGDDIQASSALAYSANNKGRGLMAFAAGYSQKFTDTVSGKIGVGYLQDVEEPVSDIDKHKAVEVNANVNYALVKGLDIGLYGAYAFLTDWEDYQSQVVSFTPAPSTPVRRTVAQLNSAGTGFEEADDIYKIYARVNYSF